jgi:hypothetical protein
MDPLFKDAITLFIALWGAILSTGLFVREILKEKRELRVSCNFSLATPPTGEVWEFITITAVNVGHRPNQF